MLLKMTKYLFFIILVWPFTLLGQKDSSFVSVDSLITDNTFVKSALIKIQQNSIPYSTKKSHISNVIKSSWKYIYGEKMRIAPNGAKINRDCIKKWYLKNIRLVSSLSFENMSFLVYEIGSNKSLQRFLMISEKVNNRVMVYICDVSKQFDFVLIRSNTCRLYINTTKTYLFESNR